ncbi:MAG: deoxyribose-phosphate aldolase [Flavobacteriaceae bacterium]|nr:deoxyribose-phosphate aldolase [Flavobacteriaceae bacterium]
MSCKQEDSGKIEKETVELTAQTIVDSTIQLHGGDLYANSVKKFDFRGKTYIGSHEKGSYTLERMYSDSTGSYSAIVSSLGLHRFKDEALIKTPDSMVNRYSNSVNSVHYFAYLPYALNDKAVNKKLLGKESIKGKDYHKIEVTFEQDGGGDDFEDTYVYWINTETFTMDYLAYLYHTGKGGIRFREAYNPRTVNGIRFLDYNNYKPKDISVRVHNTGKLFGKGELELLSKIELENISVELLD